MTKKLGDYTLKELKDICDKYGDCVNCPFMYSDIVCQMSTIEKAELEKVYDISEE